MTSEWAHFIATMAAASGAGWATFRALMWRRRYEDAQALVDELVAAAAERERRAR